jgi:heat shock protein HslJ
MKKLNFLFLFVSVFSFGQDDVFGEWFLSSLTINGYTYNNVYGNAAVNFSEDLSYGDYLVVQGNSTCNGINGAYSINDTQIIFGGVGQTLLDCGGPKQVYENLYINLLNYNNDTNTESSFSYLLEGTGDDQTLTLVNPDGDSIFYQKGETNANLIQTWYLESVTENGITYDAPTDGTSSLTLGSDFSNFWGPTVLGTAECNTFTGFYYVSFYNGNSLSISEFTPTEIVCNPISDFETAYFSIFGNEEDNTFSFEITNNGETLILTAVESSAGLGRSIGDIAVFSDQSLSIDRFQSIENAILLIGNPVKTELQLKLDDTIVNQSLEYSIYATDGKVIQSSKLISDTIDISELSSGLYIIRFQNDNQFVETHRFIKK